MNEAVKKFLLCPTGSWRKGDAFTLFEVLVVISILAIIVSATGLILINFKNQRSFEFDARTVSEAMRNAQNRSIFRELNQGGGQGVWGIRFTNSAESDFLEIFYGNSYNASNVVLREAMSGSSAFTIPAEGFSKTIVFQALSGVPDQPATIALTRSLGTDVYTISVNALGKISREKQEGLEGYWSFDGVSEGSVYDASGNGYTGTVYGAVATSSCRVGTCLDFDGTTNYVDVGGYMGIEGSSDRTVSFWMYSTKTSAQSLVAWGNNIAGEQYIIDMQESDDALRARVGGGVEEYGDTDISDGQWMYCAVVFQGSDVSDHELYINGVLETDTKTSPGLVNTVASENLHIGYDPFDNRYFEGKMGDVRIYSTVLDAGEILTLYESY